MNRAELMELVRRKSPAPQDPDRLMAEVLTAERKKGFFKNSDRAGSEDRQASAVGTFTAAIPCLTNWINTGATVKRGRKIGGDKTGSAKPDTP